MQAKIRCVRAFVCFSKQLLQSKKVIQRLKSSKLRWSFWTIRIFKIETYFKTTVPATGEFAFTTRTRAYAVTMGFVFLPITNIYSTIVKVIPAAFFVWLRIWRLRTVHWLPTTGGKVYTAATGATSCHHHISAAATAAIAWRAQQMDDGIVRSNNWLVNYLRHISNKKFV